MENTAPDTTEQKIFDAAGEVFLHKGMDGATMQEIADKAGINKALLHYYYRSKDKLFAAVAKAILKRAIPSIQALLEEEIPLEEKIDKFIAFYLNLISRNPFLPIFLISEMNKHPQHFQDTFLPDERPRPDRFFEQVREAAAEGRIRPVDPRHLIVSMIALCAFPFIAQPMMRVILGMSAGEMDQFLKERRHAVHDLVMHAIKPSN